MLNKLWRKLTGNWWEVRRCGFPYDEGYGTCNIRKRIVLDTGLTKEEAEHYCRQLNGIDDE